MGKAVVKFHIGERLLMARNCSSPFPMTQQKADGGILNFSISQFIQPCHSPSNAAETVKKYAFDKFLIKLRLHGAPYRLAIIMKTTGHDYQL